jgi:hypothetical protein
MNPLDTITLEAFLTALAQLDSVPSEVRTQLKQLGSVSSASIGRLHYIAEAYPPLYTLYQEARLVIGDGSERNKGPIPEIDREVENASEELINLADEIFNSSNPASTIKQASNKPGVLKRLLNLVKQPRP